MKKIKQIIEPLLFIFFSSLLTGIALFFFIPTPEAGGERHHGATPITGQGPVNREAGETLAYKNETVYVVLDPEGRVIDQRIVNRIYQCKNKEAEKIKDYGNYRAISNMTSDAAPIMQDNIILWDSTLLQDGDIYYEGLTDKRLPVDFQIKYYLDGEIMEASALAGKSGKLRIVIKIRNNLRVEGAVAYRNYYGEITRKEDLNYVPLLVQGTYTADLNRFSEIEATDGTGIITGQNMSVNFMAFPYPEAEIVLTMRGEEIELNQITLMIIPQLPPLPDMDMEDDLLEMLEGVTAIEEGLTALYEGADQLYQGLDQFRNRSNEMLSEIEPLLSLIEELPPFLDEHLPEYFEDIQPRLEKLQEYFDKFPGPGEPSGELPEELDSYFEAILELTEQIDDLDKHYSEAEETFEQLAMLPEALNELADGQKMIRDGLEEINSRGILEMKKGLIDGVNEIKFGKAKVELMRSLADGYRSHADNENNLESSVQFILQTETIKQQETERPDLREKENEQGSPEKAWYMNLWSRFLDLFASFSLS